MNRIISYIGLVLLVFITGCSTMTWPPDAGNVSTEGIKQPQLFGGIQPTGSGQIFPPHNNLPMNNFIFTGSGPAVANNEPCTYGQSACKTELVNNAMNVSALPSGKPVGTQEVVNDWNGTAGLCVGGSSGLSLAVFNGSVWICLGGSGGGGGGGPGQVQSVIAGNAVAGGSGTMTCNEFWVTSFVKEAFCVGNAYYNPTNTAQTWTMPTTSASGIPPTLLPGNSTPFSTIAYTGGNVIISFPFSMGGTWTGVIATSSFY